MILSQKSFYHLTRQLKEAGPFPSLSSPKDDSRDASPPEPASPTIGLDKKTRRKFLDLG